MLSDAESIDLQKEALQKGQRVLLRAQGGSMRPTVYPGDGLVISGTTPRLGEIALVWQDNVYLAHRVVAEEEDSWWLLGDARGCLPHRVPKEAVLGRVIEIRRAFGGRWRARG